MVMYLIFLGLFLGARTLVQDVGLFNLSLSSFIVSYLMWFFVISSISRLSYSIELESQQGVLEQIYLNYPRYLVLQFIRAFVDFIEAVVFIAILLSLILVTTGRQLHFDPGKSWEVFLVVVLAVVGINGFSLFFGGLALLFKRIGQVGNLMQFVFFLIAYLPIDQFKVPVQYLMYSLPLTQGIRLLKLVVVKDASLFSAEASSMLVGLAVNSAIYLLIGSLFFLLCEKKAKLDGRLGQY